MCCQVCELKINLDEFKMPETNFYERAGFLRGTITKRDAIAKY